VLIGLVESNGHQNYKNWETMMGYHPRKDGAWVKATNGVYELNDEFYKTSGGILIRCPIMKRCLENSLL
jgi:hypothetical protein